MSKLSKHRQTLIRAEVAVEVDVLFFLTQGFPGIDGSPGLPGRQGSPGNPGVPVS